jgi:hypothetical protein
MPGSPEFELSRRRMDGPDPGRGGAPPGCALLALAVFAILFVGVVVWFVFVAFNVIGAH